MTRRASQPNDAEPDWRLIVSDRLSKLVDDGTFPGGRERLDEIVEELAQHLDDQYADARRRGMSRKQAEREALREGADWPGMARAIVSPPPGEPQNRLERLMENLTQDIRFALRTLAARPLFTFSVIFLLAMGIGANTALFTVVNSVLLRPLPFQDARRLVNVGQTQRSDLSLEPSNLKAANVRDLRERAETLDGLVGYWQGPATLTGQEAAELLAVIRATHNFLAVLGVDTEIGSPFPANEPDAAYTAVLDHRFWVRKFAADPDIVGDDLMLDDEPYTVIGVMPEAFRFLERADAYIVGPKAAPEPPLNLGDDYENDRSTGYLSAIGRLKDGATLDAAVADLDRVGLALEAEFPDDQAGRSFTAVPLRDSLVGPVQGGLYLLLGAVGLVLLIACANVANLLLARASGRGKEMAVRTALGASRGRVVRQLLTESLALAGAGGLVGVGISILAMNALRAFVPDTLPRAAEIGADASVLGFTLAISLLTGLLFGAAPAWQSAGTDVQTVIRGETRGASAGRSRARLRDGLVVAEIAIALVLLIGAGLTLRSLLALQSQEPGFEPTQVLTLRLSLPQAKYDTDEKVATLYESIIEEIRALRGVESAAVALALPFSGTEANFSYTIDGQEPPPPGQEYGASFQSVSSDFFRTLEIPLLAGRDLGSADSADVPMVAVINDVLARRHFPDVDPTTQAIRLDSDPGVDPVRIVGVVGGTRHLGYDAELDAQVYLSVEQMTFPFTSLLVRASGDPEELTASVRTAVAAIDPDQPVYRVETLESLMSSTVAQPRFNARLLGLFAGVAVLLAAVGVFGVISYTVSQRTHELGIRMALGADSADVLKMVFRRGSLLVGIGIGIGGVCALALSRLVEEIWFGISAADPLVFATVPAALAAVALLACYLPARRATRVDPVIALRAD